MSKNTSPEQPWTTESWVDDLLNRFISVAAHSPARDWTHDVILGCGFTYFKTDMDAAESIGIGYLTNEERTAAAVPLLWMLSGSGARIYGLSSRQVRKLCPDDFREFEDALLEAYLANDREEAITALMQDHMRWLVGHPEFTDELASGGDA